jgi:hypothetical protein
VVVEADSAGGRPRTGLSCPQVAKLFRPSPKFAYCKGSSKAHPLAGLLGVAGATANQRIVEDPRAAHPRRRRRLSLEAGHRQPTASDGFSRSLLAPTSFYVERCRIPHAPAAFSRNPVDTRRKKNSSLEPTCSDLRHAFCDEFARTHA